MIIVKNSNQPNFRKDLVTEPVLITMGTVLRTSPGGYNYSELMKHLSSAQVLCGSLLCAQHRHQFPEDGLEFICQAGLSSLTQRVLPNMFTIKCIYTSGFSYCLNRILTFPGAGKQFRTN